MFRMMRYTSYGRNVTGGILAATPLHPTCMELFVSCGNVELRDSAIVMRKHCQILNFRLICFSV